jgi:hypothetical protein
MLHIPLPLELGAHDFYVSQMEIRQDNMHTHIYMHCQDCKRLTSFLDGTTYTHTRTHRNTHIPTHTHTFTLTYTHIHIHARTHINKTHPILLHEEVANPVHMRVRKQVWNK